MFAILEKNVHLYLVLLAIRAFNAWLVSLKIGHKSLKNSSIDLVYSIRVLPEAN